jgi:pimeloyl-ACP methyl ester carboxylesterase
MPDLQGHGLSGRPDASYSLAWHARVISGWIAALGIDVFDLIGHSFGGGIAQWLLLDHLRQVRRLGLIAAGGLGREVSLGLRLASLPYVLELFGQPLMAFGTHIGMRAAGGIPSDEEITHLKLMNARPGTARAVARTVRDVINWRGQRRHFLDRAQELEDLPPTALYWGDRDKVIPFAHALEMESLIEGATITRFNGVGHFPHHERPMQMVAALTAFLDAENVNRARLRNPPAIQQSSQRGGTCYYWKLMKRGFGMVWRIAAQGLSTVWRAVKRV